MCIRDRPPWARDAAPKGLGSYEDPIALWGLPDDVDADAYDLDACDATIYDDTPVQSCLSKSPVSSSV